MPKVEDFDLHDPAQLREFIKTTIEEALAPHAGELADAALLSQYPEVAKRYGDDPDFAEKLEEAFKLVGKNEGLSLLEAYEQVGKSGRQSSRTTGNTMDRLGKPSVNVSRKGIL